MEQATIHDEKMDNLRSLVKSLQDTVSVTYAKMSVLQEDKDFLIISTHVAVDKARNQLRNERRHTASLMFVIHSQVRPFLVSTLLFFSSAFQSDCLPLCSLPGTPILHRQPPASPCHVFISCSHFMFLFPYSVF